MALRGRLDAALFGYKPRREEGEDAGHEMAAVLSAGGRPAGEGTCCSQAGPLRCLTEAEASCQHTTLGGSGMSVSFQKVWQSLFYETSLV